MLKEIQSKMEEIDANLAKIITMKSFKITWRTRSMKKFFFNKKLMITFMNMLVLMVMNPLNLNKLFSTKTLQFNKYVFFLNLTKLVRGWPLKVAPIYVLANYYLCLLDLDPPELHGINHAY